MDGSGDGELWSWRGMGPGTFEKGVSRDKIERNSGKEQHRLRVGVRENKRRDD